MKDLVFRLVLLAVVVIAVIAWLGWLQVDNVADRTTINVETGKIERAIGEAAEEGRDLIDRSIESVRGHRDADEAPPPPPTPAPERAPEY